VFYALGNGDDTILDGALHIQFLHSFFLLLNFAYFFKIQFS
jgi:hypothetical protein